VFDLRILLLTTNTIHHKYLIKKITESDGNNLSIIYCHKKKFRSKPNNTFEKKQYLYERSKFFNNKYYKPKNKIYYTDDINSNKTINLIKKLNPNYGILFGTKKVSKKVIQAFKNKLLNIHRGIMQKYRGLDSELWAIYNKDFKNLGATIHFVNEFLDKGKIISEKKLKLSKSMKCFQLRYYTTVLSADEILKFLKYKGRYNKNKYLKQKVGRYYSTFPSDKLLTTCKMFDNFCSNI